MDIAYSTELEIIMTDTPQGFSPDWVSPPGESIADLLEEHGWTQAELAERLGYTAKHLNQLIKGKVPLSEKVGRTSASDADFWNPDDDPRGLWRRSDLTAAKPYSDGHYVVVGPHGDQFSPRGDRYWSISRETFRELERDNRIWWGKTGRTFPYGLPRGERR